MPAPARAIDLVQGAGVRKPPKNEPVVGGAGGGRLWRFDGGVARASGALVEGVARRQRGAVPAASASHLAQLLNFCREDEFPTKDLSSLAG
jgi:hypothetical protein